ncbi:MGMT family protein [Halobaculum marinum]|uniref:MGMT family protein n=1 Tax=Halobaculum marinum TaxID=3031996 RepID=A0ABD5X1X0_9EURY|nr:MGMT family protein [Halobaculum sp. DT55]
MPAGTDAGVPETGVFGRDYAAIDSPVELGTASGRLLSVSFPETLSDDADGVHALLDRLHDYFDGAEDDFADVAVAITVPTVQREVLESVRTLPYGDEADLELIVRMTSGLDHEDESDLQTARQALRANPIPIVVPDHRVRGVDGATPAAVAKRLREIEGIREF